MYTIPLLHITRASKVKGKEVLLKEEPLWFLWKKKPTNMSFIKFSSILLPSILCSMLVAESWFSLGYPLCCLWKVSYVSALAAILCVLEKRHSVVKTKQFCLPRGLTFYPIRSGSLLFSCCISWKCAWKKPPNTLGTRLPVLPTQRYVVFQDKL